MRRVKIIDPDRVAVDLTRRPELELFLGSFLPVFRLICRKPEPLPVDPAFELQAAADDIRAIRLDRRRRERRRHIEHTSPLSKRSIVRVNIFVRRSARREEALQGFFGITGARVAVTFVSRSTRSRAERGEPFVV